MIRFFPCVISDVFKKKLRKWNFFLYTITEWFHVFIFTIEAIKKKHYHPKQMDVHISDCKLVCWEGWWSSRYSIFLFCSCVFFDHHHWWSIYWFTGCGSISNLLLLLLLTYFNIIDNVAVLMIRLFDYLYCLTFRFFPRLNLLPVKNITKKNANMSFVLFYITTIFSFVLSPI